MKKDITLWAEHAISFMYENHIDWIPVTKETVLSWIPARILSWDEVWEKKLPVLWVQDKRTGAIIFKLQYIGGAYEDVSGDYFLEPIAEEEEDYGKEFVLWTNKPSNEQMWQANI